MDSIIPLFTFCMPCCSPFEDYSTLAMKGIDKALGNLMSAHVDIAFLGLLNQKKGTSKLVHYQAKEKIYDDVNVPLESVELDGE